MTRAESTKYRVLRDTRYPPSLKLRRAGEIRDTLRLRSGQANYGFTLIELVMTLVVVGIVAGIAVPLGLGLFDSLQDTIYRKDLSESADVALRRMTREIRRLKSDRDVVIANATTYSFVDKDNQTTMFQLNGVDLERVTVDGVQTDVLATNVSALTFTYYDDAGNVISTPLVGSSQATDIRLIEVNLTFDSDNNTISYRTQVRPRNVTHLCDLFS